MVAAADAEGTSVSGWITTAATEGTAFLDGRAAVAEWEAEHGALTDEELATAHERVGHEIETARGWKWE